MQETLIACRGCDRLHENPHLALGQLARCVRCGDVLRARKPHTVDRSLAAALAALVFLVASLLLPFLGLARAGIDSEISVLDAVRALWTHDMLLLALVTFAAIALVPAMRFGLIVWVLWRVRRGRSGSAAARNGFRWALRLEPWAMAEIFMIGVVVSLAKVGEVATLVVGPAFWSLIGLIAASVLLQIALCPDTVWRLLDRRKD